MANKKNIDDAIKHYSLGEEYDVHMLPDPTEQALFYQMERLTEQYAKRFFNLLFSRDIGAVDLNLPLVYVCKYDAIYSYMKNGEYIAGQVKGSAVYENNRTIRIVLPVRSKRAYLNKSLKSTIRHELIHYYLCLRNLPYRDNDGLFWAYCYIYDAGAYMPMSEADKKKYDRFVDICEKCEEVASYNDLQTLAEAIMLDDESSLSMFNQMIEWRTQLKASLDK